MKKIFALALAAVMTAGMTTVAFAAPDNQLVHVQQGGSEYYVIFDGAQTGKADEKLDTSDVLKLNELETLKGGTVLYFPLWDDFTGGYVGDEDDLDGWRLTTKWTVGDAEKAEFTTIKYNGERVAAIKVTVPESDGEKAYDLVGSVTMYGTGTGFGKDDASETNGRKINLSLEYGYDAVDFDTADAKGLADAKLVDFDGVDDVVEMEFGDYFLFEVDVTGQGKLNLKNNQKFNKEFAEMYDYANIDFITFEYEPTFNKNGVAYIYADEDAFVYEVTADGAKEIPGLTWDEDYEAWTFKTRTLKSYAISDVELDEKTVTEDNTSSTTDGDDKPNPDTGR